MKKNPILHDQKENKPFFVESGDIYRAFFRENSSVILLIDPENSDIMDANKAACEYYGWPVEEITRKKIDHINALSDEKIKTEMEKATEENRNYFFSRHRLANGEIRDVEVHSGSIEVNSKSLLYYIVHDITERKLAEEELKRREMQLRAAQKIGHVGSWEVDLNSSKADASEEARRIYGLGNEELTIEKVQKIPLPKYRPMLDKALDDLVKRNIPYEVQFKIIRKDDGKVRVIHAVAEYYAERNAVIGMLQDITERKHVKTKLRERKSLLNEFGRISKVGGWELDVATGNVNWTTEVARIHELKPNDMININIESELDFYPSGSRELIEEAVQKAIEKGQSYDLEVEFITAKGKHKWIRTIGHPKTIDGKVIKITGSFQDITERKEAENKIAEEAMWRRILMEQSRDGIVINDQNGKVFEANPRFAEMLGYSHEEIHNLYIWDWDVHYTREQLLEMIKLADDKGILHETRQKRKDGTLIDVEINANAATFGERKMSFCVCRDISERKKVEEELLNAKIAAEAANQIKSEFLATMSHELRTPLNSIIGFSDILINGLAGDLNKKQAAYLTNVSNAGNHLLELINDILDISKVEAGKMELECEQFHVSDAIDEIRKMIFSLAINKGIKLDIKIENAETHFGIVYADKTKFKQVLYNLTSNAIKFTPEEGCVTIEVRYIDNFIQVSVEDTGIGIANRDMDKLFLPFKQLNPYLTREYGGTGLGLALVKKFVGLHGGKIRVESKVGEGSIFTFTIPIYNEGCDDK